MTSNTESETQPSPPYIIDAQFTEQFLPHICDPISQLEKTLKVLHYQQIKLHNEKVKLGSIKDMDKIVEVMAKVPIYEMKIKKIKAVIAQLTTVVGQMKVDASNLRTQMEKDSAKYNDDDSTASEMVKEKGAAIFAKIQEGLKQRPPQ